jgi:hypothetical protein
MSSLSLKEHAMSAEHHTIFRPEPADIARLQPSPEKVRPVIEREARSQLP